METPTEQEIIAAHSALFTLADFAVAKSENREQEQRMREYNNTILKVLPDKPDHVSTMADVEWDDDKHAFAEAEHPIFGKVIMLNKDIHGNIECLRYLDENIGVGYDYASSFIPTGKQYKMTKV